MKENKYLPQVNKIRNRKMFFFLGALLLLILVILFIKNLLAAFVLSFVMFFILNPIVDNLERRGFSRLIATTIPFLIASVVLAIFIPLVVPSLVTQFESLKSDFPKYIAGLNKLLEEIQLKMEAYIPVESRASLAQEVQKRVAQFSENLFKELPEHISNSLTVLFLAPFLGFFMLVDGRELVRRLLSLVPNNFFELALNLNHQISTQMGGFIRARMLESAIVAAVIWVGLLIMGFPYALLLASVAGLLNLIPYIGPIIGAIPAFLIVAINSGSSADYLWLSFIYGLAQIIDLALIVPLVVAKIVDMHPVTVVLAVMIGAQVMGVMGMIISIPIMGALKVTFYSLYKHMTEFRD